MDQSGFDNQHREWVSATEAARILDVKRATLYAYASRGKIRGAPGGRGRERLYLRADLERIRRRAEARSGHTAVAAGALVWGEPVLDSGLTAIREDGPWYRGRGAVALARAGVRFEQVAELLWAGVLPDVPPRWRAGGLGLPRASLSALLGNERGPFSIFSVAVPALGARDPHRFSATEDEERARARALLTRLAALFAFHRGAAGLPEEAARAESVAEKVAFGLGARGGRDAVAALDRVLVVCADHELNASTFAARIAASTGADLYQCVCAALGTAAGPRHGAACDRVEALLREVRRPERAAEVVAARSRRGEEIPGVGHRLYPSGDPRAVPLLEVAREIASHSRSVRTISAVVEALARQGRGAPSVDFGVVAVAEALRLPPGSAAGLFALGRTAGWIAHVLEQRQSRALLRPRARYVGPRPSP